MKSLVWISSRMFHSSCQLIAITLCFYFFPFRHSFQHCSDVNTNTEVYTLQKGLKFFNGIFETKLINRVYLSPPQNKVSILHAKTIRTFKLKCQSAAAEFVKQPRFQRFNFCETFLIYWWKKQLLASFLEFFIIQLFI